jgi:RNA recognition motif-containing protein
MASKHEYKSGVVVLRNIPKGFNEVPMMRYFSQFGKVNKLRISRSAKTGKTRQYAYIEFECDDVAKIVADTMNNYLMFERLLKCEYVTPEKVHPAMFKSWNVRKVTSVERHKSEVNSVKTTDQERKLNKKRLQKIHAVEKKLKELGIEFKCVIVDNKGGDEETQDRIEIDSEDDIEFKTPPHTVKVKKQKKSPKEEAIFQATLFANKAKSATANSLAKEIQIVVKAPTAGKKKNKKGNGNAPTLNQDNAVKTPTPKQAPIYAKPNIPSLKAPKPKKVKTPQLEKAMTPTPKKIKTPQIEKATTPTPKKIKTPQIEKAMTPTPKKIKTPQLEKATTPTPKKIKTPQLEKVTTPTPKKIKTPKTATPSETIKASILKTADSPATPADGKKLKVRILEPKTPKTPKAPKSPKSATKFSPRITRSKTPKK